MAELKRIREELSTVDLSRYGIPPKQRKRLPFVSGQYCTVLVERRG
jgi:hypothetical protein